MSGEIIDGYSHLPYPYPLIDLQPVVRIPVAGPAPYNTLAVVRTVTFLGEISYSDGTLRHHTFDVATALYLTDYRPDRPQQQQVQHSSTGTVRLMDVGKQGGGNPFLDSNTDFVISLDSIDTESSIDEDGRWSVRCHASDSYDQVWATAQAEITSWVLCYEPPDARPRPRP
ncbi:hypothetical protein GCM10022223_48500 [Kineosporia mesophila]|uniref:Uncharacterized protein n=1 Tax=Kineosporia mesophila TaxID=566012 RepID=A0ABP7A646_9ACTN|nr:hypothetical protein [Kineosporia mesophila]MCD5351541.1 hypothetical protein [Kineosporia mesophila]